MRVLSYNEAAERAGIVRRSLQRLIACGDGPAIVHVSIRRRGVIEADLERWLLSRRRAPPGEAALSKTERDPQSDAPKKRGRPAGVKLVSVAQDRAEAAEAEQEAV
jgi:hypothetical protein